MSSRPDGHPAAPLPWGCAITGPGPNGRPKASFVAAHRPITPCAAEHTMRLTAWERQRLARVS